MTYRILKKNSRFVPQVKKNFKWKTIQEEFYDQRDGESFKIDKDFSTEQQAMNFIKQWHSNNIDTESVVKEVEIN